MLPVESLADVIALFKYFDLGSLLLSNKQLSNVARQAAGKIRPSDFSGFSFHIHSYYGTNKLDILGDRPGRFVHSELFANEVDMDNFVSKAFRHCVVGDLAVLSSRGGVISAITEAASTVVVTGTLRLDLQSSFTAQEIVDVVDSFQRVKKLRIMRSWIHGRRGPDLSAIKDHCRRKKIHWV